MRPEELTVKLDAATEPNLTAAAPEKPAPVMDIGVPPSGVAVICVDETTWTFVALFAPNLTAVAPVRLDPLMVTAVPPDAGPEAGLRLETAGPGGPAGLLQATPVPESGVVPPVVRKAES